MKKYVENYLLNFFSEKCNFLRFLKIQMMMMITMMMMICFTGWPTQPEYFDKKIFLFFYYLLDKFKEIFFLKFLKIQMIIMINDDNDDDDVDVVVDDVVVVFVVVVVDVQLFCSCY